MQTDARTTGLKACPFCEGEAAVEIDDVEWDAARVVCKECGATGPWEDLNDHASQSAASATVKKRWNTRTPALEATQGAHEGVIEACAKVAEQHGAEAESLNTQWMANKIATAIRALSSGKTVSAGEGEPPT